ncbi:MAG: hypothetical protein ABI653_00245, partial [Bacteroidota bacterium]
MKFHVKHFFLISCILLTDNAYSQMSSVVLNDPPLKINIKADQKIIDFNEKQPGFNLLNTQSKELYY